MSLISLLNKIRHYEVYKEWKRRQDPDNNVIFDYDRGAGYYEFVGFGFPSPVGKITEFKMRDGRVGIYKLIKLERFRDPSDMIKHGYYQLLGYKGEILLKDMTFEEFLDGCIRPNGR